MNDVPRKRKAAIPNPSAPTDGEQPLPNEPIESIAAFSEECNTDFSDEDCELTFQHLNDPGFLYTISMKQLYQKTFAPKHSIIDGVLFSGTYILAGTPKVGKSFLVAQIAYHVSTGLPLWGYPVRQGSVLYMALEDDYARLQSRLYKMFGSEDSADLHLTIVSKQLGNGLSEQLKTFIAKHSDTKLIIIDTLCRIREANDKFEYATDYSVISELKQISDQYNLCMLVVHHTRKDRADDVFDMIAGTHGLMGAADGALVLWKQKRTDIKATLEIVGRDQQDQRFFLERNEETLVWDLLDTETELWKNPPDPILEAIAKMITADSPKWVGSASQLAQLIQTDKAPNALTAHMNVNMGRLEDDYNIHYENCHTRSGSRLTLTLCV